MRLLPGRLSIYLYSYPSAKRGTINRQYVYTMSKRPPPPPHFPQTFANRRAENNSRSATHSATQPTAGNPLGLAIQPPQGESSPFTFGACAMRAIEPRESVVPNDGTYRPQQPAPHTSLQSSASPPVHRSARPPVASLAPTLTHAYSSSPPHPHSRLPSPGSVPQPPSFPVPSVPGGYGAPSNASGLVPPPSLPMAGRAYTLNTQAVGYHNVAAPDIFHQQSATVDRSRRA